MRKVHVCALLLLAAACSRGEPTTPLVVAPMDATFAAQHAELVEDNPAGLSLELRVDHAKTRFKIGEPIPLVITFSGSGAHEVSVHNYDRSGRMWSETFSVDPPDDAADPLATYFGAMGGGMGGISPMPKPVRDGPVEIPLTLNEWVRFDRPGTHQLFVTSTRTGKPATTNVITIEIEDDPAWVAAELKRIRSIIAEHRDNDAAAAAFRSLRFLGTTEAADEIAAQLCIEGDNYVSPLHFGAYGARDREHMISALEAGLAEASCAVSGQYLRTLTKLKIPDGPATADWADVYERALAPSVATLDAALGSKTPRARAVSTHAVLTNMREQEQRAGAVDPAAAARRTELAGVFENLPDEARARVLADEWLTVRSPDLAPVLAQIVKRAQPRGGQLRSLSDLALERWIELEPEPARAFIIAELSRATGARVSFDAKTLGLLPDTELPDLDSALIAGARATTSDGLPVSDGATLELRAEIIARYASPAVVADVWELYRASTYFRMSLLTYLVRVEPKAATGIIATLSLDDIQRLAEIRWSRVLQDAAVAHLEQDEPSRADRAAALLGTYADATVLPALWKRIESMQGTTLTEGTPEANLHHRIRRTIATAKGWTITKKGLERLQALCLGTRCKDDVRSYIQRWNDGEPSFVLWSHPSNGEVTGWIGQYGFQSVAELEQKMLQLPSGTVLVWGTTPDDVDAAMLAKVSGWAKERDVILRRPVPATDSP